jgi:D-sedoheptulose 7-phosphate isomerase
VDNRKFIRNYLSEMKTVIDGISAEAIDKAVGILFAAWKRGSAVYTCGNGGSASTATHFVCDLAKATIVEGKMRFKAFCLNDNIPLVSALTNDNGFENIYYEQLKGSFQKGDVLICISVHGGTGADKAGLWSQNLIKAMKYAQETGGKTIGLAGFDGGLMKEIADACIVMPVDSTPHVESLHLAIEHLICQCLKQRITEYGEGNIS